jgi:hypothetical protein
MERIIEWENQHSSIELSRKLKELGCSINTCFNWVYNKDTDKWHIFANSPLSQKLTFDQKLPAYSASELLKLLPSYFSLMKLNENDYMVSLNEIITHINHKKSDKIPSNALAKMLVHLIENKLIEV